MLDIDMTRSDGYALVRGSGSLTTDDDADVITEALAFVPEDEHVVIDLTGLSALSGGGALRLCDRLLHRVAWSEAVVVSAHPDVTMQLVLHDVDRVVPVVRTCEQAVDVIRSRSGLIDLDPAV